MCAVPTERLGQDVQRGHPLKDVPVPNVDERRSGWLSGDDLGVLEVVLIVGAGPSADRERDRQGGSAATRSTHALLVVKALWRHVRQAHEIEAPDVNARLHGGRDAENFESVDGLSLPEVFGSG